MHHEGPYLQTLVRMAPKIAEQDAKDYRTALQKLRNGTVPENYAVIAERFRKTSTFLPEILSETVKDIISSGAAMYQHMTAPHLTDAPIETLQEKVDEALAKTW